MRFDPANKRFEISVRELAEEGGFRRIGSGSEMWSRFGIGTDIHVRVLKDRCAANPKYRGEVHLQVEISVADWTAVVTGRLDGCTQNAEGGWLIEEFKSCFLPEHGRLPAERDTHRRQLLVYCDLWRRMGNSPVTGALVYVDITSGKELSLPIRYDPEGSEKEVLNRRRRGRPCGGPGGSS